MINPINKIKNMLSSSSSSQGGEVEDSSSQTSLLKKNAEYLDNKTPSYPPKQNGILSIDINSVYESQLDIINKIKYLVDADLWDIYYAPTIKRFIKYVHLLPASESHHHRGVGGLFRHGLEVAYQSVYISEDRVSGTQMFPGERREHIKKWKYAVFAAGLCHDIGKPLTDVTVIREDGDLSWNPYQSSLVDWLNSADIPSYNIIWRKGREGQHSILGPMIAYIIIGSKAMAWLSDGNPTLPYDMTEAIMGKEGSTNLIRDMVRTSDASSVSKDLKNLASHSFGDIGIPVERFIIDALRSIYQKNNKVNKKGALFWYVNSELFVLWDRGAKEAVEILRKDNIPAIPKDPDTIADILIDRNLAVGTESRSLRNRYWLLSNCEALGLNKVEKCIKLSSYNLIIDFEPEDEFGHAIPYINKRQQIKDQQAKAKSETKSSKAVSEVSDEEENPVPEESVSSEMFDFDLFLEGLSSTSQIIIKALNLKYNSVIMQNSFIDKEEKINIVFPTAIENLGIPSTEILKSFSNDNLISLLGAHNSRLLRKVVDPKDKVEKQVLVLTKIATDFILNFKNIDDAEENDEGINESTPNKQSKEKNQPGENSSIKNDTNSSQKNENLSREKAVNLDERKSQPVDANVNAPQAGELSDEFEIKNNPSLLKFIKNNKNYEKVIYSIVGACYIIKREMAQVINGELNESMITFKNAKYTRNEMIALPYDELLIYVTTKTQYPRGEVEAMVENIIKEKLITKGTMNISNNPDKVSAIAIPLSYLEN